MKRLARAAVLAFMLLAAGLTCSRAWTPTLRTDVEPLARRLELPSTGVRHVRWVAAPKKVADVVLPPLPDLVRQGDRTIVHGADVDRLVHAKLAGVDVTSSPVGDHRAPGDRPARSAAS